MRWAICLTLLIAPLSLVGCSKSGRSVEGLIVDSKSPDEKHRIYAVRLLSERKGDAPLVVPALVESLKDTHADIRSSAAIGLGYFGADAKSALPALEKAKDDKDARVREAANNAIKRIGG